MKSEGEHHKGHYNHEYCVAPSGVEVKGFWLLIDCSARQGDHRLFDWQPGLEAIPSQTLQAWRDEGETSRSRC